MPVVPKACWMQAMKWSGMGDSLSSHDEARHRSSSRRSVVSGAKSEVSSSCSSEGAVDSMQGDTGRGFFLARLLLVADAARCPDVLVARLLLPSLGLPTVPITWKVVAEGGSWSRCRWTC